MKKAMIIVGAAALALTMAVSVSGATFSMKLSGAGAVNDSTIKAGEKVSIDLYFATKDTLKAFSSGFKIYSKTIEKITHLAAPVAGLSKEGDVKGWNGWEDKTRWDFGGVWPALKNWDGELPDTAGFAGATVKKRYAPHESMKVLSWDIIVPTEGVLIVDTSFYPPGGSWKVVVQPKIVGGKPVDEAPVWKGPYKWTVVK